MAEKRPAHRIPRSTAAATALLERYAALEDAIAVHEAVRNKAIADANAVADKANEALIAERDEVRAKLQPWWKDAAAVLTGGKRKSIELGGCMIGTRAGRDSLAVEGDEDAIVLTLQGRPWAKPLLRVTTKLERAAILKSIDGVYRKQLAALGLSRKVAEETFFVQRAEQAGTQAKVQA